MYDIILTVLTWLCFTIALLSSIRPDKWLAMSAEWIRLSARVLASSLKRKHTFSTLINIASFHYIRKALLHERRNVTLPCDGDESGDHAVEAEHRDQQQQLESAVSAQHRDALRKLLSQCQSRILLVWRQFSTDRVLTQSTIVVCRQKEYWKCYSLICKLVGIEELVFLLYFLSFLNLILASHLNFDVYIKTLG